MITPETTWRIIQFYFWSGVFYTILVNYISTPDATPSAVIAQKASENYWIPVIVFMLAAHWFWPSRCN